MATIQKSHIYKVSRHGVELGLLTVENELTFSYGINSAGSQITLNVPLSADTSGLSNEVITDETGATITDENNDPLYTEGAPDVVGNQNDEIMIRNGNTVTVFEFSDYYPNGKQMFVGEINRWEASFGEGSNGIIKVLVYSQSQDLDNYLIQV